MDLQSQPGNAGFGGLCASLFQKTVGNQPGRCQHKSKFHSHVNFDCIEKMYHDKLLCDVVLVADGVEIAAHKLILASCSTYFYFKFSNDRKLGLLKRIELKNITFETLSNVLTYLYSAEISITKENIEDLLAAAYMFALRDLHKACTDFLQANLGPDNCITNSNIARRYQCTDLIPLIDGYIGVNFSKVLKHSEYLKLTYPQILNLIRSDALCTAEENVLECVITWVKNDLQNRKQYFYTLMDHVRTSLISQKDLILRLDAEQWLKSDPGYNGLLGEIFKSYFLVDQTPFLTTPRLPSKILVVAGVTIENCLNLEMYDFQKNIWLQCPGVFEDTKGGPRAVIHGMKLFCITDNNMKFCEIKKQSKVNWLNCRPMLDNQGKPNSVVLANCIYSFGDPTKSDHLTFASFAFPSSSQLKFRGPQIDTKTMSLTPPNPTGVTAEKFDISKNIWNRIATVPDSKIDMGLVAANGYLYAAGGKLKSGTVCDTVHCYEPTTNTWQNLPSMSFARSLPGVAFLGNSLYVVGGYHTKGYSRQVETLNLGDGYWRCLPDMSVARQAPGVIAVSDRLYVIGGYNNIKGYLNSVEVYDVKSNFWTMLKVTMNNGISHVTAAIVDKAEIEYD